jgi:hypothetical protein
MGPSDTGILQEQIVSFPSKEERGIKYQVVTRKPFNLLVENHRAIHDDGEKVSVFGVSVGKLKHVIWRLFCFERRFLSTLFS